MPVNFRQCPLCESLLLFIIQCKHYEVYALHLEFNEKMQTCSIFNSTLKLFLNKIQITANVLLLYA